MIPGLLVMTMSAASAAQDPNPATTTPTRLKWQCTEQQSRLVVVNGQGELASETKPAGQDDPVQIHAIPLDSAANGASIPTRVISNAPALSAASARWSPGNAITSSDGHLRLDLTENKAFLLADAFGNQALFRRFDCHTADDKAPMHYQCGPDFDLWVEFRATSENKADTSAAEHPELNSVHIQYPGGAIALPQARSGSGARYAEADSSFWIKGDSATFSLGGDPPHACQLSD
jgi:membrane-bound inhibitor of C-type lysozyme